jgi:undecaprenyl diphosphate synthase
MRILQRTLGEQRDEMRDNGIRMAVVGRMQDLPPAVQETLHETMDFLAAGEDMLLNLALSYGGRTELLEATQALAREVLEGTLAPEAIDEAALAARLYTAGLPDPDLLIRTGGESRISNFLLWQAAYAEIWLTETFWPDFRKEHLFRAILDYQRRERRFGRVR